MKTALRRQLADRRRLRPKTVETMFKVEFIGPDQRRIRIVQVKPLARWWHNGKRQSLALYADEKSAQQAMFYGSVTWSAWIRHDE